MAKRSLGDKASRVLNMLMGLRDSRISTAMAAYGFADEDLEQAWGLLKGVGAARLSKTEAGKTMDRETLRRLDEWENKWYPLVKATLQARYPTLHDEFFRNLFQASGAEVIVTVETFLQRLDRLAAGEGAFAADGPAAREVLEKRGIDDATVTDARRMLEALQKQAPTMAVAPNAAEDKAALEAAEKALWSWYLEWSQVARTAISNKALLKMMGLAATRRRGADLLDDEDDDDGVDVPAPAPAC